MDFLQAAEAVPVQHLATEQIGDGRKADVRVRPHVDVRTGRQVHRPHVIEKHERPDHALFHRRQHATHAEAAEITGTAFEQVSDHRQLRGGGRSAPHILRQSQVSAPRRSPPRWPTFCG